MKMRKNKKGFTLVELIVVITVLAILAAIAIPIAGSWTGKAKSSSDVSNVALFQSAVEKSVADGNNYPANQLEIRTVITSYTALTLPIAAPTQKTASNAYKFVYDTATHKVACTTAAIAGNLVQIDG